MCLVTTHGRIAFPRISSISSQELDFMILPLKFPFFVDILQGDRIYLVHGQEKLSLSCVFETQPREVYESFVEIKKFDAAISYATQNDLDLDYAYKKQWVWNYEHQDLEISILDRITDKSWVLEQCTTSIFESTHKTRSLMEYGVMLTNRISASEMNIEVEKYLDDPGSTENKSGSWPSVMDIFFYRTKLLDYLDRLCTYETIFEASMNVISGKIKLKEFFSRDLVDFAAEMAAKSDIDALEILFTRHGSKTLPFRLSLLNLIPITKPPIDYANIIPEINSHEEVVPWEQVPWRTKDWTEDATFIEFLELLDEDQDSVYLKKNQYPESLDSVKQWYLNRVETLEKVWGLTSCASYLSAFAIEKGITGIGFETLSVKLKLLDRIARNSPDCEIWDSDDLSKLSPDELIELLLDHDSQKDGSLLTEYLYPYVLLEENLKGAFFSAITSYCTKHPLWINAFVQEIQSNPCMQEILPLKDFVETCAYAEVKQDSDLWSELLKSLRTVKSPFIAEIARDGWGSSDFDDLNFDLEMEKIESETNDEWNELDLHVRCCRLFEKHGKPIALYEIRKFAEIDCKSIISQMIRKSQVLADGTESDWANTLLEFTELADRGVFHQVHRTYVTAQILSAALNRSSM